MEAVAVCSGAVYAVVRRDASNRLARFSNGAWTYERMPFDDAVTALAFGEGCQPFVATREIVRFRRAGAWHEAGPIALEIRVGIPNRISSPRRLA